MRAVSRQICIYFYSHSTDPLHNVPRSFTNLMPSIRIGYVCFIYTVENSSLVTFWTDGSICYPLSTIHCFVQFALHSQVQLAGYDPATTLIGVKARPGEVVIRKEDVFAAIDEHGDSTCLVMFGAVNWGSGQLFDIPEITEYAHSKVCTCFGTSLDKLIFES